MFKSLQKYPDFNIGLFQAVSLILYVSLVASVFWKGEEWFDKLNNYTGPILFLNILIVSVLICGLISFSYPIYLFWEQKKTIQAMRIVAYTALFVVIFILLVMSAFLIF